MKLIFIFVAGVAVGLFALRLLARFYGQIGPEPYEVAYEAIIGYNN